LLEKCTSDVFHPFEEFRVFALHTETAALNGGGIQGIGEGDVMDYLESYSPTKTNEKMAALESRHIKKQRILTMTTTM